MQREDKPIMETGLERIAAKAKSEPKLRFTSLAHHITRERVWTNLCQIPKRSAPGVDGQTVTEAKETFGEWVEPVLRSVHRQGYRAPDIRRVYIPKPGKREKRPLGVPCVNDRALQRSTAQVLSAIYEADFLPCSFGGRPERGAHHALATLNEVIAGGKVSWVLEADLKNFFGSLSHEWVLRFVEHRVGDPRMISLIQRWLKAGVCEAIVHDVRAVWRLAQGRNTEPLAAIVDCRTLPATPESGTRAGSDEAKRQRGITGHRAVDPWGTLLALHVTPAHVQDCTQMAQRAAAVHQVTGERVAIASGNHG